MTEPTRAHEAAPIVRRLSALDATAIAQLADVLIDCVDGGASVGFMAPLSRETAHTFWAMVAGEVQAGKRLVLVAEDAEGICGTVQLVLAQPENQPHRADVSKMLVHRRARRRGLGGALLRAVGDAACDAGKTLLVLDTITGSDADRLYGRHGWIRVGEVPDYALMPHGMLRGTTFFYRRVGDASRADM